MYKSKSVKSIQCDAEFIPRKLSRGYICKKGEAKRKIYDNPATRININWLH